jgi:ABC-type lipoprotein release transport system permease subunit
MTRGQIRKLVACESVMLGVVGAVVGTVAGITTSVVIHWCNEPLMGRTMPYALHFWLVAANAGGCLVVAMLAAWTPSERAARLNLLSAIAYE